MCGIIATHLLVQGGLLNNAKVGTTQYWIIWLMQILVYCSVDVFAMLSGYLAYGKKQLNSFRAFELVAVVAFYCISITTLLAMFRPDIITGIKDVLVGFFPLIKGRYWYITCYFPILLLSPYYTVLLEGITVRQHRNLLIICLFFFSFVNSFISFFGPDLFAENQGYSFMWLSVCYVLGAYLKRADTFQIRRFKCFLGYFLCAAIVLLGNMLGYKILGYNVQYMASYISPFVVVMAVCTFCYFKDIKLGASSQKIKSIVKRISDTAFDVYIIHSHIFIFDYFLKDSLVVLLNQNLLMIPVIFLLLIVVLYFSLSLIGIIRIKLFEILGVQQKFIKITRGKFSYTVGK